MLSQLIDSLTEKPRKEALLQMIFSEDIVQCTREKDVLELEPEQWRKSIGEERNECVKSKYRVHAEVPNRKRHKGVDLPP